MSDPQSSEENKFKPRLATEDGEEIERALEAPTYSGGGGGMDTGMKDYVDARDEATRALNEAQFARIMGSMTTKTELISSTLALAALLLAIAAFGNQVFTSGANLSETARNNAIAIEQLTKAVEAKDAQLEQQSEDIRALVRAIELQAEQGEDEQ